MTTLDFLLNFVMPEKMHESIFFGVVMLSAPVSVVLGSLATLVGFSMFAYFAYAGCDPLKAGYVSNPNQVRIKESNLLDNKTLIHIITFWLVIRDLGNQR